jgi:hypothetical protein
MADDLPYYETLFGMYLTHWKWSYGSGEFVDTHYILTKEYQNEGCETVDYTTCSTPNPGTNTFKFLYPHWIKKHYYIEGVVEGHISFSTVGLDDTIISYELKLMKVDDLGNIGEIGTTGTVTINKLLTWNGTLNVGDEIVLPFYITISPEEEMLDKERLYVEIIVIVSAGYIVLYHSNDATWEDLKISIPFRGL